MKDIEEIISSNITNFVKEFCNYSIKDENEYHKIYNKMKVKFKE